MPPVLPEEPMQEEGAQGGDEEPMFDPDVLGVMLAFPHEELPEVDDHDQAAGGPQGQVTPTGSADHPLGIQLRQAAFSRTESGQGQQVLTYEQLGISTEVPRRPDMAMINARVATYRNWPPANSHTPIQLAEAGFYYAGHDDCVCCFYCGVGPRHCERNDNPWIQHARWFPRCPYVRQCHGQDFIDIVQDRNATRQQYFHECCAGEMAKRSASWYVGQIMMADQRQRLQADAEIRQRLVCKICLDKEVCIVFLPCGHLVCCAECSPVMGQCPMCVPAYWVIPSGVTKVEGEVGFKIDFTSAAAKKKNLDKAINGDGNHQQGLRTCSAPSAFASRVEPPTEQDMKVFRERLSKAGDNAIALSLVPEHCNSFRDPVKPTPAPKSLKAVRNTKLDNADYSTVLEYCDKIKDCANMTPEQASKLERKTREQSKCEEWFAARAGRVTASQLHAVCHTSIESPSKTTVSSVCYPQKNCASTKPGDPRHWGITQEETARHQYTAVMAESHVGFCMEKCGLFVNPEFPYIGASPDGVVKCT
ncbi:hypothetical protein BaRGS_00029898 [Batillaria attramentaria]|uniref:RING-type domain-containing protein n=1 Tax=Batillaria attramentaria TaxID=370345 RepID=A0ABD0JVC6_9CAEN